MSKSNIFIHRNASFFIEMIYIVCFHTIYCINPYNLWRIMYDFVNFTKEQCKELMLEYQETRDYEIFHVLLARYDRFILDVIYKFQRKVWSLSEESLQELYHTGILGFVKAILAVKEDFDADYLCNRIRSYIISELKQEYLHRNHTDKIRELILIDPPDDDTANFQRELSMKLLLESSILSISDKNLLKSHYFDEKTTRNIAKELGVCQATVVIRLRKAREKIFNTIINNNYNQRAYT